MWMTVRRYAELRGVFQNAIEHAVRTGVIRRDSDGRIDSDQADATWFVQHRARLEARAKGAEHNDRFLQVQLAAKLAKMQLAKSRYESRERDFVERSEIAETGHSQVLAALTVLGEMSARYAPRLAAAIPELSETKAKALLQAFIDDSLAELGDVEAEAKQAAEAL